MLFVSVAVACSSLVPETAIGSRPQVSSFRYTETTTGNIEGESLDSPRRRILPAPDSAHVIGDAEYFSARPKRRS